MTDPRKGEQEQAREQELPVIDLSKLTEGELREELARRENEAREKREAEGRARPLAERLVYAAYARCPCGAGIAYDPFGPTSGPFKVPSAWDCSAIILGTAIPKGQPGSVEHTGVLPFAFYEIKSENQPSAGGATTRPTEADNG